MLIDFSSISFLEFRERTKREGSFNFYRYILGSIEELRLFDSDRTTSGDDEKMMLKVVPYPGDEYSNPFFPLDSVLHGIIYMASFARILTKGITPDTRPWMTSSRLSDDYRTNAS